MNLHKNARTCPKSRALMAKRVVHEGQRVAEVAEQFGVSERTVYKWVRRYCEGGEAALLDGASTAKVLRHKLSQEWVDLIVELRREYHLTALRIARQLKMARSTVSAVLQRENLSQLKNLEPKEPVVRYEHDGPGELLHMDIKKLGRFWRAGHRATGNRRQDSEGAGWEFVHVCVDDYSRVAYVEVLEDERQETAIAFFKRAVSYFRRMGVRTKRLLTDNGSCYRAKAFLRTCKRLGIKKKFTRPYRPQTNGKAERLIRTLLTEWAYGRVYKTSNERKRVLPMYVIHYNQHREHCALGNLPPITRITGVNNAAGVHS